MKSEKKTHALYSIVFEDGTKFVGGNSFFETKWKDIPKKKIKRIFCRIPGGDYLTLGGYDQYYYMVEVVKDWARIDTKKKTSKKLKNNIPRLEYFYIMGRKKDFVISYRVSLKAEKDGEKYKLGDITKRIYTKNSPRLKTWGLREKMWK